VYDALKKNAEMRITSGEINQLGIVKGGIGVVPPKEEQQPAPAAVTEG
jgi:hypothetical protein